VARSLSGWDRSIQEGRDHFRFGTGLNDFGTLADVSMSFRIVEDDVVGNPSHQTELADKAKKCSQSPKLILSPALIRVVVTLGAVPPSSQENPYLLSHRIFRPPDVATTEKVP